VGPVSSAENAEAIGRALFSRRIQSLRGFRRDFDSAGDAGKSRTCSNVARPNGEAARARDADVVAIVEEAIVELDAGRVDSAKARFKAFMAATRGVPGA
jgi:hypothetical protein